MQFPLLRVAAELVHAGLSTDAARLGVRVGEASISSEQEVPGQLAIAFLITNGYVVPHHLRQSVMRTASRSQHYPSVVLLYFSVASQNQNAEADEMVAEGLSALHLKSFPNSMQTLRGALVKTPLTQDFPQSRQARVSQSECLTSRTASGVPCTS
jgi:hypothetical protein